MTCSSKALYVTLIGNASNLPQTSVIVEGGKQEVWKSFESKNLETVRFHSKFFSIFSSNKNPPSTKYSKLESAEAEAEAAPPFQMMEDLEADTLDQVSII